MASDRRLIGSWGEAEALKYLRERRYEPVGMGYRTRFGEIDLIVRDDEFIVFVEVKLRRDSSFAEARESVGAKKRERLKRTAEMWLSEHPTALQPRFDVIEIYAPDGARTKAPRIVHIEDAF